MTTDDLKAGLAFIVCVIAILLLMVFFSNGGSL